MALHNLVDQLNNCGATNVTDEFGLGTEAFAVTGGTTSAVLWRRGDVVMYGTVDNGSATGLMPVWKKYDATLSQALTGVCVNQQSTVEDGVRSPWADPQKFRGLGSATYLQAPDTTPVPIPVAQPGQPQASRVPIPGPSIAVPPLPVVSTPSPPVTPAAMPVAVPSPVLPTAPKRPPRQLPVYLRQPDPSGPGCGWAFTRQSAPTFDVQAARTQFAADKKATKKRLASLWSAWQVDRTQYDLDYAAYASAMVAYQDYVTKASQVAASWAQTQSIRDAYVVALNNWRQAVAQRRAFFAAQARANQQYRQKQAQCQQQQQSSPSPSPSASPSSSPSPSPKPTPGCPPKQPKILKQKPPPVPPEPAAPDASFPEYQNPGHKF